ncbi:hypothetical protein K438DRAFT_1957465 [Mycena galopus ATCC 62051]|nr:hypothetical protein K438DRAFT_1957465 [Mycena galopus ATCC 62051]
MERLPHAQIPSRTVKAIAPHDNSGAYERWLSERLSQTSTSSLARASAASPLVSAPSPPHFKIDGHHLRYELRYRRAYNHHYHSSARCTWETDPPPAAAVFSRRFLSGAAFTSSAPAARRIPGGVSRLQLTLRIVPRPRRIADVIDIPERHGAPSRYVTPYASSPHSVRGAAARPLVHWGRESRRVVGEGGDSWRPPIVAEMYDACRPSSIPLFASSLPSLAPGTPRDRPSTSISAWLERSARWNEKMAVLWRGRRGNRRCPSPRRAEAPLASRSASNASAHHLRSPIPPSALLPRRRPTVLGDVKTKWASEGHAASASRSSRASAPTDGSQSRYGKNLIASIAEVPSWLAAGIDFDSWIPLPSSHIHRYPNTPLPPCPPMPARPEDAPRLLSFPFPHSLPTLVHPRGGVCLRAADDASYILPRVGSPLRAFLCVFVEAAERWASALDCEVREEREREMGRTSPNQFQWTDKMQSLGGAAASVCTTADVDIA